MLYRGKVSKVTAAGVWVVVADIVPGFEFGPCQRVGSAPSVGASVLVADVSTSDVDPDLIVIGALS